MPRQPMERGAHGKITTTHRGNAWVAKCRHRDQYGVTRQVEASGKSAAEAERRLKVRLTTRSAPIKGELSSDSRISALVEAWRREFTERDRATNTRQRYADLVDRVIVPTIGQLRIYEITVSTVEWFVEEVKKKHGAATARTTRQLLGQILAVARRRDLIPVNPVKDSLPVPVKRKEVRALSVEDIRALRAKLRDDKKAVSADLPDCIDMLIASGCRIGELLAVRWSDLDLGADVPTVTIQGTVVRVKGEGLVIQDRVKSATSRRKLALPRFAVDMLLRRQVEAYPNPWNVVFPSSALTLKDPAGWQDQWRAFRDTLGEEWDWITPHTFRKSVATLMPDSTAAAAQLGHASTAITERHYIQRTHAGPELAAQMLQALVDGA